MRNPSRLSLVSTKAFIPLFAFALSTNLASAQIWGVGAPETISYQGVLTNTGGTPVSDGTYSIRFRLYRDGQTTGPFWEETHPSVQTKSGVFVVILGSVAKLDKTSFNEVLDLGIKVGSDAENIVDMTSVPYALGMRGVRVESHGWGPSILDGPIAPNVVIGHEQNMCGDDVIGCTIGGGGSFLDAQLYYNAVYGDFGTVSGGWANHVNASAGTISGGNENITHTSYSTIAGGSENVAGTDGDIGGHSAVGGGEDNQATGEWSTIPGGLANKADGDYSLAVGYSAQANHDGSFVWRDRYGATSSPDDDKFVSTGVNQFLIQADGGVGIGTNSPGARMHIKGGSGTEFRLEYNDGSFWWDHYLVPGGNYDFRYNGSTRATIDYVTGVITSTPDPAASSKMRTDRLSARPVLDRMMRVQPVTYAHPESSATTIGIDINQVYANIPEVVSRNEENELGISYDLLSVVAIKALQEQQVMIEELREEIRLLRAEVARR